MIEDINISAKFDLKGNKTKAFLLMFANGLTFFLFALYCCTVYYISFINNSFFISLSISENRILSGLIIAVMILLSFGLLLLHIKLRFSSDCFFHSLIDNADLKRNVTLKFLIKLTILYIRVFFSKILIFIACITPSFLLAYYGFYLLKNGISTVIVFSFSLGIIILLLSGIHYARIFSCRYESIPYDLCENEELNINFALSEGINTMSGSCAVFRKLKNSQRAIKIICLFVLTIPFIMPIIKMQKTELIAIIKNPQMIRRPSAEKTIIFYVNKPIEST